MGLKIPDMKDKHLLQKCMAERGQHYFHVWHKEDAKSRKIWQILKGCKSPQWEETEEVGWSSGRDQGPGPGCVKLAEHSGGGAPWRWGTVEAGRGFSFSKFTQRPLSLRVSNDNGTFIL